MSSKGAIASQLLQTFTLKPRATSIYLFCASCQQHARVHGRRASLRCQRGSRRFGSAR